MTAVVGSGSSSMSDSWIAWKPRIDEPSNIRPSVKTDGAEVLDREGEVLHDPGQVAEADVDELDVVLLDVGEDLVGVVEHPISWRHPRPTLAEGFLGGLRPK